MAEIFVNRPFPRQAVWVGGALMALALAAAFAGRWGGMGVVTVTPAPAVASRVLAFEDRAEGGIVVRDGATGALLVVIPPGEGGFLRGVMRGFARERRLAGEAMGGTVLLTRRADGLHTLHDSLTGRTVVLEPFGPTNAASFTKYLAGTSGGTTGTTSGDKPQ